MHNFKEISVNELSFNPFDKIGKEWLLITSGDIDNYNTMTASWGMMGFIWNKPVINCFVRPQRYTFEFVEKNDIFTISFFNEEYKPALNFCGTKSGRDYNKANETGLTPINVNGSVSFEQANLIFVCKKVYAQFIESDSFIDKNNIIKWYENNDFHKSYIGEILKVYTK